MYEQIRGVFADRAQPRNVHLNEGYSWRLLDWPDVLLHCVCDGFVRYFNVSKYLTR
jgi:hypothetical protein